MSPEEIKAEIAQWERYIEDLREEADQVKSVQPTGYYAHNRRGQQEFRNHINRRAQSIHDDFMDAKQRLQKLNDQHAQVTKALEPKVPRPMSEAEAARAAASEEKKAEDKEVLTPEKKRAESYLEQQKEADATSIAQLGATLYGPHGPKPQSYKDLRTQFQSRFDRKTGEHVFTQENVEGNLTAEQKRQEKELETAFKNSLYTPEEAFGRGVRPPSFNKNGDAVAPPPGTLNANPFIGTQSRYNQLKELYEQSRPKKEVEIRVDKDTLKKAYDIASPAYRGALGTDPAELQRKQDEAIQTYGMGEKGDPDYVPPSINRQIEESLIKGKADSDAAYLQRPTAVTMPRAAVPAMPALESETPLKMDIGGIVGAPPKDYGAFRNFGILRDANATSDAPGPQVSPVPPPPPVFGPQPATPEERQKAGAVVAEQWKQRSPNAAAIIQQFRLKGIDENDPAVTRALADDSYAASKSRVPGQLADVADTLGDIAGGGLGWLGKRAGKELADAPWTIMNAWRTYQGQQAREEAEQQRADDARRAAGLEVAEEAPPSV